MVLFGPMSDKSTNAKRLYEIRGIRVPASLDGEGLLPFVAEAARVDSSSIESFRISKRSLDARGRREPVWEYSVQARFFEGKEPKGPSGAALLEEKEWVVTPSPSAASLRPLVVGAGPGGLFAALRLLEYGFRPVILEQGNPVEERAKDVAAYWRSGEANPCSNVQFGEGGAGAYSDGKLTTRIKDFRKEWVLGRLADAGGGESVLYEVKPHLGTDRLRGVIRNIRQKLLLGGAEIRFGTKVEGLFSEEGRVLGIALADGEFLRGDAVFLAAGHSCRDLYSELSRIGVSLSAKGFAIGLRVEVPQAQIDFNQYGKWASEPSLPRAEFAVKGQSADGRGVYSFCMCPGGTVIPAGVESGGVVVNGMSGAARSGKNANAALVAEVRPEDFGSSPLGGLVFQRLWEERAFELAGKRALPSQSVASFLGKKGRNGFSSNCPWPLVESDLKMCLPDFAAAAIVSAFPQLLAQLPPLEEGRLIGVETRTSSPVRIDRDGDGESLTHKNLYPVGEGAGYAGGIVSAAVDGARAADSWAAKNGGNIVIKKV